MPNQEDYNLSNIFAVQNQYVADLKARAINDPNLNADVAKLEGSLDNLKRTYNNANGAGLQILDHQTDMQDITQNELSRLYQKKGNIDSALEGQKRLVFLNDNYRQRYAQYNNMVLIAVVALLLIIGLFILGPFVPFVPSYIFDILVVIIVIIALYLCQQIYVAIQGRNKMDFNKLDLPIPKIDSPEEKKKAMEDAARMGDLLGSINLEGCRRESCCSTGTHWDYGNAKCVGNTIISGFDNMNNPFSTLSVSYKLGEFNQTISPNSPNEFSNYAKI